MPDKNHPFSIKIFLSAWLPPVLWASFIYVLSAQSYLPGFDVALFDFIFKKSSHMFVYAVLYLLMHRGLDLQFGVKRSLKNWLIAMILCLIYASLDEVHQIFSPHRTPTLRDVGYDFIGILVAFLWKYRYI